MQQNECSLDHEAIKKADRVKFTESHSPSRIVDSTHKIKFCPECGEKLDEGE